MPIKPLSQRVKDSQNSLKTRGGRRMPSGFLQPEAAQALADLVAAGYAPSPVAVISFALLDARRKIVQTTSPPHHVIYTTEPT